MADVLDGTEAATTAAGTAYTRHYLYPDGTDQRAVIYLRDDYNGTDPLHVVVFFHGISGDEYNFDLERNEGHRDWLMDEGRFAVIASNGAGKNCGNTAGNVAYRKALDYFDRTYARDQLVTYGQSMGGLLAALVVADATWPPVAGVVGISPVLNLESFFDNGYPSPVRNAYGFTGSTFDDAATAGHDPVNDYAGSVYAEARFRLYASSADTAVLKAENADELATLVAGHTSEVEVVACTGGHLSTDHYRTNDFASFVLRAVGEVDDVPPPPPTAAGGAPVRLFRGGMSIPARRYLTVGGSLRPTL